jgi:DNA repair protein SbcC/Rad50
VKLLSLRMRNFRQHADSEIHFRPGLTGIIGPNGAGKSTILEAIAWAVYGADAARGTNDTIRFARAAARQRVEVELRFSLGAHDYRVTRTLAGAEVYQDGGATPVAVTVRGATEYLQSRIGMTREEFFNTYFTGQKELAFLATMGAADRRRFLSQVLGYERIRKAQEIARERKNELVAEVRGLRAGLGDLDELTAAVVEARVRQADALDRLRAAKAEAEEAAVALKTVTPRWEAAQAGRDRHRELTHAVEAAEQGAAAARREVERAAAELASVEAAAASLAPLTERLAALPALDDECRRLAEQARKEERRKALAGQLAELEGDLRRGAERMAKIEAAPELERRFTAELEESRAERAKVEAELEEKKSTWLRDRQDAETKLQSFRELGKELQEQIRNIREFGREGKCPTCGRPVGDDYERLLDQLEDKFQDVKQDGVWWRSRFDQLKEKPEEVAELEAREKALSAQADDRAQKLARCQSAVQELAGLRGEQAQREERREALAAELARLPAGYDRERHRAAERELDALREVQRKAAALEETVRRRPDWEAQREEAARREAEARARFEAASAERAALAWSEEEFTAARDAYGAAMERRRGADLRQQEMVGEVRTAEAVLQGAERAEREYHERAKEIEDRVSDQRYHEELVRAFDALQNDLNDQVRPDLSDRASLLLAQLTDGRYTALEVDEKYNVTVQDEGEPKPVISGGEEDVVNLVLRISLSQMIADRAGQPLSLLILDEVFGSLDVARRDNVVQLLHALEDRFDQVVLITHIEGIREGLDQVLRVEYDERTGTSVVREESVYPMDPLPEAPMAAD